jgi:hypothetical protein
VSGVAQACAETRSQSAAITSAAAPPLTRSRRENSELAKWVRSCQREALALHHQLVNASFTHMRSSRWANLLPDAGRGNLPGCIVDRRRQGSSASITCYLGQYSEMANGPTPDTNTRPRHIALLLGLTANAHELRRIGSNELLQVLPWRRKPAIVILVMKEDRHDL